MKVLITGGAGFIGCHLSTMLTMKGYSVVIVDRRPNKHYQLDMNNLPVLIEILKSEQPDTIFHMAANSDISKGAQDSNVDLYDTFLTTHNLLQAMRETNLTDLVFASSSAVYGAGTGKLLENRDLLLPHSFYGAAKVASEAMITAAIEMQGLVPRICRFANVVGPCMTHGIIPDLINKLKKNPYYLEVLGNGQQTKSYIHINDLLTGMMLIWKQSTGTYNIGVETVTTVADIVRMVTDEMALTPSIHYTGTPKGWPGDVPQFRFNIAKLSRLGWCPTFTSDQAVRLAIKEQLWSSV